MWQPNSLFESNNNCKRHSIIPDIVETWLLNSVPTTTSGVSIRIPNYSLVFRITKFGLSFLNFTSNCRIAYSFYNRIGILNFGYAAESVNCQTELPDAAAE